MASQSHRLEVVRLPGHAPEVNPVEALCEELAADAIRRSPSRSFAGQDSRFGPNRQVGR